MYFEEVARPETIHDSIAEFQERFEATVSKLPKDTELHRNLRTLGGEIAAILLALENTNLDASATSRILERWGRWCSEFDKIATCEDELRMLFIALPS
jgi:hypothetical protein